jgi:hypothetical protein
MGDLAEARGSNEPASVDSRRRLGESGLHAHPLSVGRFILGVLVGIVIVIVILVQCTRAIF